ncbi:MAG: MaoC family dehydratase [Chloroflexi bacterium]|nr:MaoC family dehydratase [Chloroflexota bacterium]MYD17794.1 MaoC family dehydratase [Chloroflexota bacterium]
MTAQTIERSITAFLDGEDSIEIDNIIHSTEGAAKFGFSGALVGGVTVYSWAVPALIEALGEEWLDSGWIDFRLRRPVYPGDEITTRVVSSPPAPRGEMSRRDRGGLPTVEFTMAKESGEMCIAGAAGMGEAEFYGDLAVARNRDPVPAADPPTLLTPQNLPIGEDLPAMAVPMSTEDAEVYADHFARDPHTRWRGEGARLHPGWIAGRCVRLTKHTYHYPAGIHAGSQIQMLAPARAGQTLVVSGHVTDGYRRKEHEYCLLDVTISDESGEDIARLRHRTIYQVGGG